jgi:5-methylcytosine-specific restriction endonuclease McrA
MKISILTTATALSDHDLLVHLSTLAGREREATVDLIAHLAALDARPPVYRTEGYRSLFAYCTGPLRLSEDAACSRIDAARASRRFPAILDMLAAGRLTLTSVRLLGPHLTAENHEAVLDRAKGRSRREVEILVAELAPRPDLPTSVRKLPTLAAVSTPVPVAAAPVAGPEPFPESVPLPVAVHPAPRPVVQATAPERYRVQFTVGQETHDKLRRLQALLRREIPDGDPAAIVDQALTVLLDRVERAKLGVAAKPRSGSSIRPGTDWGVRTPPPSRYISRVVRRAVWRRDGDRCGFISPTGVRCTATTFLELHHVRPYARGGASTVENISLRCRAHNQHEALLAGIPCVPSDRRARPSGTDVGS